VIIFASVYAYKSYSLTAYFERLVRLISCYEKAMGWGKIMSNHRGSTELARMKKEEKKYQSNFLFTTFMMLFLATRNLTISLKDEWYAVNVTSMHLKLETFLCIVIYIIPVI